jgi:hypothetical protein
MAAAETAAIALTGLSAEYAGLQAKAARTSEEDARLKTLEAKIEAGNGELSDFFRKTLYPELAQKAGAQDANALLSKEKSEVSRLQNTLAALGPRVMGIRLLLGEEHAYAIVVTAQARKKIELKATPAELRGKVLQVRDDLRDPASAPKPHLAELYAMAVAPLEDELKALEQTPAPTGRAPVLLRNATSDPVGLQHGERRCRQERPGDGQPGHDRPTEGRGSRAGHAMGCERRKHQPVDAGLLLQMGERSRRWQSGGIAPGSNCSPARVRRVPGSGKRARR